MSSWKPQIQCNSNHKLLHTDHKATTMSVKETYIGEFWRNIYARNCIEKGVVDYYFEQDATIATLRIQLCGFCNKNSLNVRCPKKAKLTAQ